MKITMAGNDGVTEAEGIEEINRIMEPFFSDYASGQCPKCGGYLAFCMKHGCPSDLVVRLSHPCGGFLEKIYDRLSIIQGHVTRAKGDYRWFEKIEAELVRLKQLIAVEVLEK